MVHLKPNGDVVEKNVESFNIINEYFSSDFSKEGLNNIPISVEKCLKVIHEPLCSINITDKMVFEKLEKLKTIKVLVLMKYVINYYMN